MKSVLNFKVFIISLFGLILILLPACNFIKVGLIPVANKNEFEKLATKERNYILHVGEERFILKDIKIEDKFIKGTTDSLPNDTIYHVSIKGNSLKQYMPKHKRLLKNVNIYVSEFARDHNSILIPYTSIERIEVYSKEYNMAATGYFFMGIVSGFLILCGLVIIASIIYGAG